MGRLILLAAAAFVVYILVRNELRKRPPNSRVENGKKTAETPSSMVKDPVCGAYVEEGSSLSVRDSDTVYRFCSYECRDAFLQKLRKNGREIPEYKEKDKED